MNRLSNINQNLKSIKWLTNSIDNKDILIWCGYGVSFSFAQLLAEALRQIQIVSYAIKPDEIIKNPLPKIIYLSQSAKKINSDVSLIITQEKQDISWTKALNLSIKPQNEAISWLPLEYTSTLLFNFAEILSIKLDVKNSCYSILNKNITNIFISECSVIPIQTLLFSVASKTINLPIISIDINELGHGLHYQIWKNRDIFNIICLVGNSNQNGWLKIFDWLKKNDIKFKIIEIKNSDNLSYLFQTYNIFINILIHWFESIEYPYQLKPIPNEMDNLR